MHVPMLDVRVFPLPVSEFCKIVNGPASGVTSTVLALCDETWMDPLGGDVRARAAAVSQMFDEFVLEYPPSERRLVRRHYREM